jgi:hypothetical protein
VRRESYLPDSTQPTPIPVIYSHSILVARRASYLPDSTQPTPIPTISEVSDIYSTSPRSPLMEVLNLRDIRYLELIFYIPRSKIKIKVREAPRVFGFKCC